MEASRPRTLRHIVEFSYFHFFIDFKFRRLVSVPHKSSLAPVMPCAAPIDFQWFEKGEGGGQTGCGEAFYLTPDKLLTGAGIEASIHQGEGLV